MWKKFAITFVSYYACSVGANCGAFGGPLTVKAVLRACAANFARCATATKVIDRDDGYGVIVGGPRDYQSTRESYYHSVGGAVLLRDTQVPILSLTDTAPFGTASVNTYIWTGRRYFFTGCRGGRMVIATFSRHHSQIRHDLAAGWGFGIAKGILFGDLYPFTKVFREPGTSVRLSKQAVRLGSYRCLRLRAEGPAGKYTIWVAPACGYAIVRAAVRRGRGDNFLGRPLGAKPPPVPKGATAIVFAGCDVVVDRTRLSRRDGAWFPASYRMSISRLTTKGIRQHSRQYVTVKSVRFSWAPKAVTFVPKIPEGSQVVNMDAPTIQYIWHNGKVVPAYDKAGIKKLNRDIDDLRREGAAYFTAPIAVGTAPAAAAKAPDSPSAGRPLRDPVAASTGLWCWGIAAAVSVVAATFCVLFLRKNNSGA